MPLFSCIARPLIVAVLATPLLVQPAWAAGRATVGAAPAPVEAPVCRLIPFDHATVTAPDRQPTLQVDGWAPVVGYTIRLAPLTYTRQPEYWGIEVTACGSGIHPQIVERYQVTLDLQGTIGSLGIEVVGLNRSVQIQIAQPGRA